MQSSVVRPYRRRLLPKQSPEPVPRPIKASGRLGMLPSRPTFRSALPSRLTRLTFHGTLAMNRQAPAATVSGDGRSALSLWLLCPAPPVSTPTACDCLAARPPRAAHGLRLGTPGFYSGPTPRLQRFALASHLPDQRQAPATKPAPEVLPALVMFFTSWVTWLEGVIPQTVGRMSGLPPRHSFRESAEGRIRDFWGQNTEAPPYPSAKAFRRRL